MPVRARDPHRWGRAALVRGACTVAILIGAPNAVLGQVRGGLDAGPVRGVGGGGGGSGLGGVGLGLGAGILGGVIAPMLRGAPPDRDDDPEPRPPRRPPPAAVRSETPIPPDSRPAPQPRTAVGARTRPVRPPPSEVPRATPPRTAKTLTAPAPSRSERAETARPLPKPIRKATAPAPTLPPATPPPAARNAPPSQPPARPAADEPSAVPGEVLVTFRPAAPGAAADRLARRTGLRLTARERFTLLPITLHRYAVAPGRSVASVVRTLQADPQVETAQPNHVYALVGAASPALAGAQYAVGKLRLAEARDTATGRDVPVAVIDSGVDAAHPALVGALAQSWDAIAKGAMPPGSAHAHGTAVAGLVGGRGPLASPAPEARLLAIRAFTGSAEAKPGGAQGTTIHVLRAVDWAAGAGARVVNMSFAGPADSLLSRFLAAGTARGTVYVAAVGNAGAAAPPLYPAADPNVIAVTATDAEDRLYATANRGGHLCIAAPGADILAAMPGGGYGLLSGTSMAAPEVAGIVAMLLQADPTLTPIRVREALTRSARDLGRPGHDPEYGAGLADARAALQAIGVAAPAAAERTAKTETVSAEAAVPSPTPPSADANPAPPR